jgi:hypothetical protein
LAKVLLYGYNVIPEKSGPHAEIKPPDEEVPGDRPEGDPKRASPEYFTIEGGKAVLRPAPDSFAKALRGLGKDAWRSLGGADRFLRRERDSWE